MRPTPLPFRSPLEAYEAQADALVDGSVVAGRSDARLAVARGYSFRDWEALVEWVEAVGLPAEEPGQCRRGRHHAARGWRGARCSRPHVRRRVHDSEPARVELASGRGPGAGPPRGHAGGPRGLARAARVGRLDVSLDDGSRLRLHAGRLCPRSPRGARRDAGRGRGAGTALRRAAPAAGSHRRGAPPRAGARGPARPHGSRPHAPRRRRGSEPIQPQGQPLPRDTAPPGRLERPRGRRPPARRARGAARHTGRDLPDRPHQWSEPSGISPRPVIPLRRPRSPASLRSRACGSASAGRRRAGAAARPGSPSSRSGSPRPPGTSRSAEGRSGRAGPC